MLLRQCDRTRTLHWQLYRGAGPTGLATARPKFPEPTIKNINILLFVIKQIRNLYITAPKEQNINFLQAKAEAKSSLQIRRL